MFQPPNILQKWSSGKGTPVVQDPQNHFLDDGFCWESLCIFAISRKLGWNSQILSMFVWHFGIFWFNKFWSHKNSKIKVDEGCWWYLFHETSLKYWEMIFWVIYCLSPVKIKWKIDEESNSTIKKLSSCNPPKSFPSSNWRNESWPPELWKQN